MPAASRPALAGLAVILGCGSPEAPQPTSPGLVADTLASPANLPARALAGGTVLTDGRLALADVAGGTVWLVSTDGTPPATIGSPGSEAGQLLQPIGVAQLGDTIAVVSAGNLRLERFSPTGAFWNSTPIAPDLLAGPMELLPTGQALTATVGRDSSLARLQSLDGTVIQRYGTVLSPISGGVNPGELKAEIRGGGIPGVFRNVALPVATPDGHTWLALHTEGRIERFGPDGARMIQTSLSEAEVAPIREEFFRVNTDPDQPGSLFAYLLVAAGVADDDGAWFLLAGPASQPAVLLRLTNDGAEAERLVVAESRGARLLLRDRAQDIFYLVNQQDGVVVRVRRGGA